MNFGAKGGDIYRWRTVNCFTIILLERRKPSEMEEDVEKGGRHSSNIGGVGPGPS